MHLVAHLVGTLLGNSPEDHAAYPDLEQQAANIVAAGNACLEPSLIGRRAAAPAGGSLRTGGAGRSTTASTAGPLRRLER